MTKDQNTDDNEAEHEARNSNVADLQSAVAKEENASEGKEEGTNNNGGENDDGDEFEDAEEPLVQESKKREFPSRVQDATTINVEPPTSRQRLENGHPVAQPTNGMQIGNVQQQQAGAFGSGINQHMILQQQQQQAMTNQMFQKQQQQQQNQQQQTQLMQQQQQQQLQQPQGGNTDPSAADASATAGRAAMGNVVPAGQSAAIRERQLAQMGIGGLPDNAAAMQQHLFQQQLLMGGNPFGAQGQLAHLGMAGGNPAGLSMAPFLPPDQQRRGFPSGFQGPGAFVPGAPAGAPPGTIMTQTGAPPGAGAARTPMAPGSVVPGAGNPFTMSQPPRPSNNNIIGTPVDPSGREATANMQGVQGIGVGGPGVGAPVVGTPGVGMAGLGASVMPGGAAPGMAPGIGGPMGAPVGGAPGPGAPGVGAPVLDHSAMPFGGLGRAGMVPGMVPGMGGFGGLPMPDAALQQMMLQRGGALTDPDAIRQRMMFTGGMPPGAAAAGFRPGFLAAGGGRINNMGPDLRGLAGLQSQTPAMSLSLACDDEHLSEYQILVRKQLEVFEAQPEDVESNTQGRKKQVSLGQVGIRCKHCASLPLRQRGRGAVYYPAKLQGVYQAAQNMASSHLCESCQCIDNQLKQELKTLRERRDTASGGKQYWADGARALGLVEAEDGLRITNSANASNNAKLRQQSQEVTI
eukprot:CAMPEP_0194204462 /NCGR_PEP_ID=MMETSP0156-20130528/3977_1 /TAXON_ID=33649 /ORGANISM="Thalassionema nitzschioides, Strain L26-B" /LENGTH=687 /DNA_ID=CAMNT_0038930485 /DNA_START=53 /DNA_END=2116 /DNA_ORIENTATION=+